MKRILLSIDSEPQNWVQHNLPWLAILAMVFGFGHAEADLPRQESRFNG